MPNLKSPPKADSFDEWLSTQPRRSRICATCRDGGPAIEMIAKYVELAKAGKMVPQATQLHEYLSERAGYRWTMSALSKHLRQCLGYRARG